MPLQTCASALQPLTHAVLEGSRHVDRHVLIHGAEAAAGERQKQWRLDDIVPSERADGRDRDPLRRVQPIDQRAKKTIDIALVQREEQLFLAREVQINRAFGESCLIGELGHVGAALGRAQQQPLGGVENSVVTLLLVLCLNSALANYHGLDN